MFPVRILLLRALACAVVAACLSAFPDTALIRGVRTSPVQPGTAGRPGFTLLSPDSTGVHFTNVLGGDLALTNAVAHNGSGVAIGDVDGDGLNDIYFCALQGPNRLFRNLGNWRFVELPIGDADCRSQLSTGAVFADMDGDGDLDLLVNGIAAGTRLFLNDGHAHFTEARNSGLSRTASSTSLALADIDGDGDLDLYCTHYTDTLVLSDPTVRITTERRDGRMIVSRVNGQPASEPPWKDRFEVAPDGTVLELAEVDGLYRNDGAGHFTAIQFEPGTFLDEDGKPMPPFRHWGLSAMFRDINGDGAPDLYVCNDNASPDDLWINTGRGTFRLAPATALRHGSRASMGVDFADIDRDGRDDFLVVDMLAREHRRRMMQLSKTFPEAATREQPNSRPLFNRNMLFLGRGDGTFAEAALMAGVAATDWAWCPVFLDVDLDGFEDLLVTNGFEQDVMDQDSTDQINHRRWTADQARRYRQIHPHARTANAAFRNRHDGSFEPMSEAWGFDLHGVSQGMALGDLDNDGDLDVVINNLNAPASLHRNNGSAPRVAVRLRGSPPNTRAIGARLQFMGGPIVQSQEMIAGGRYLSGDDAMRVFAAGTDPNASFQLQVRWRDGTLSVVTNLHANQLCEVEQSSVESHPAPPKQPAPAPFFADATSLLAGHVHVENEFDDMARQPLLPHRLSHAGPGLGWIDFNGDGWEDLIVTGARQGRLTLFASGGGGPFQLIQGPDPAVADQVGVMSWVHPQGIRKFLVGSSNFELAAGQESFVVAYSPGMPLERFVVGTCTLGPMAVADVNGDGVLDLFVGGKGIPGRFPEPASSSVWVGDGHGLHADAELGKPFQSVGLVSGAILTDLHGEGTSDLALALEWGPIRVFRNHAGHFTEMTEAWGFAGHTGLWTSIAAGDFDGDGRMDLVAGNWGQNTAHQLHPGARPGLFHGDWNDDGSVQIVEAWQEGTNWFPALDRRHLQTILPDLSQRFPTHASYGQANLREILGSKWITARHVEAAELESAVFLNRGDHFERIALPREAQVSPAVSVHVADLDGDGIEDLFLCQNAFGIQSDITRDDSGLGLWLRGQGNGHFSAIDSSTSGIRIEGDQRAAALGDFNHDGRVDIAVAQNNGPTRLFANQLAKPGLRVVLAGPPANPDAIGARLRILYPDGRRGPCREIHAGSGTGSVDAPVQIMGLGRPPKSLWIRWPDGAEQEVPLNGEEKELRIPWRPSVPRKAGRAVPLPAAH